MMDKLISQQAAINAVSEITTTMSVCTNKDECYGMKRMQKQAITELANLPSAEPDTTTHDSIPAETGKNDGDGTTDDLIGVCFGRLTVIGYEGVHVNPCGTRRKMWRCRCTCGKESIVAGNNLKNGSTKSCGCWKYQKIQEHNTSHGGSHDRLYGIWKNMKRRCNSQKDARYKSYGGKGIKVCDEWNDYANFKEWAYASGYDDSAEFGACTIDRIDNNGDYTPSNCRWVDRTTQANNTSRNRYVEFQGKRLTVAEFARVMNMDKNHARYYVDKFDREVKSGQINFAPAGG